MSLVDFLEEIEHVDEEMTKQAAEEDAAGRIMARGFMDELVKIAGGAKATIDPKTGKWVFRPVAMPKLRAPGTVKAPEPKFKPGSGYKPAGKVKSTGSFAAGKKALKSGYKGVGSQSANRKALRQEGVFGM